MHFIKDDEFIRGNCPMTKEEVRILSAIRLETKEDSKVLDIGAGTGSISVQMAVLCPEGQVIAIEKDEDALEVIEKNKNKFNTKNLQVINGEALEVEESIQHTFDAIFIGGSGGNLDEIIKRYGKKLKANGKMVLNFITINNLYIAMSTLKELNYETSCTQIAVSKTRGKSYMLMGNNPIFILEGRKLED